MKQSKSIKKIISTTILSLTFLLLSNSSIANNYNQPFQVSKNQMRLNLTECLNKDEWYLDGYGIAKNLPNHKENLLNKRIDFCESNANHLAEKFKTLKQELIKNWLEGYDSFKLY